MKIVLALVGSGRTAWIAPEVVPLSGATSRLPTSPADPKVGSGPSEWKVWTKGGCCAAMGKAKIRTGNARSAADSRILHAKNDMTPQTLLYTFRSSLSRLRFISHAVSITNKDRLMWSPLRH